MKKIVLLCAAGMSTSLLVSKMQQAAKDNNLDYDISAFPLSEAQSTAKDADIVLLGPQVRYELNRVKSMLPDKNVQSIDMLAYGMMDGKKVIEQIREEIGD